MSPAKSSKGSQDVPTTQLPLLVRIQNRNPKAEQEKQAAEQRMPESPGTAGTQVMLKHRGGERERHTAAAPLEDPVPQ